MKGFLLLIFLIGSTFSIKYQYQFEERQKQCFYENIPQNTIVAGKIRTRSNKLQIVVQNPNNTDIIKTTTDIETPPYTYSFTTNIGGEYSFCFHAFESQLVEIEYLSGSDAIDYEKIATKKDLNELQTHLNKLNSMFDSIKLQQKFIFDREDHRQNQQQLVNWKIEGYSYIVIGILAIVAFIQVKITRKTLLEKKMI